MMVLHTGTIKDVKVHYYYLNRIVSSVPLVFLTRHCGESEETYNSILIQLLTYFLTLSKS